MATLENNYEILKYTATAGQTDFIITWGADDISDIYFRINDSLEVRLQGDYNLLNQNGLLRLQNGLNAGDKVVIYRQKTAEQAFEFITGGALTMKMLQENNNDIFYILQDILENYLNLTNIEQVVDFINNVVIPLMPDATEEQRGFVKLATKEQTTGLQTTNNVITTTRLKDFYEYYIATTNRFGFSKLSSSSEIENYHNDASTTSDRVITSNLLKLFYSQYRASQSKYGFSKFATEETALLGQELEQGISPYTLKKVLDFRGTGGETGGGTDIEDLPVGTIMALNPDTVENSTKWLECNGSPFDGSLYPELAELTGYQPYFKIDLIDYNYGSNIQPNGAASLLKKEWNNFAFKNRAQGFKSHLSYNHDINLGSASFYNIVSDEFLGVYCQNMNYPDSTFGIDNTIVGRNHFTSNVPGRNFDLAFSCDTEYRPIVFLLGAVSGRIYNLFDLTSKVIGAGAITGGLGSKVEQHYDPAKQKFYLTYTKTVSSVNYIKIYEVDPFIENPIYVEVYSKVSSFLNTIVPFTGNKKFDVKPSNYNLNNYSNYVNGGNNFVDGYYYFFDLYNKTIFRVNSTNWQEEFLYQSNGIFRYNATYDGTAPNQSNKTFEGIFYNTASPSSSYCLAFGLGQGFINANKEFIFIDEYELDPAHVIIKKTKDFVNFEETYVSQFDFEFSINQKHTVLLNNIDEIGGFQLYKTNLDSSASYLKIFNSFQMPEDIMMNPWYTALYDATESNSLKIGVFIDKHLICYGYTSTYGRAFSVYSSTGGTITPQLQGDGDGKFKYYVKAKV